MYLMWQVVLVSSLVLLPTMHSYQHIMLLKYLLQYLCITAESPYNVVYAFIKLKVSLTQSTASTIIIFLYSRIITMIQIKQFGVQGTGGAQGWEMRKL